MNAVGHEKGKHVYSEWGYECYVSNGETRLEVEVFH